MGKPRDLLYEALCEATMIDMREITPRQRQKVNVALKELRAVYADPLDVPRRAREYARKYPHAALTPIALADHWAEFGPKRYRPKPRVELVDDVAPELSREESRRVFIELRDQGSLFGGDAA